MMEGNGSVQRLSSAADEAADEAADRTTEGSRRLVNIYKIFVEAPAFLSS